MKNWPPCCGLWFPCARGIVLRVIGEPSGQRPGSVDSAAAPGQVHDTATVTWMRSRLSIGHLPGFDSAITECTGQLHTESRRTGTRSILQIGQIPFLSSSTSGCIGQVHDNGGRESPWGRCAAARDVCGTAAAIGTSATVIRSASSLMTTSYVIHPRMLLRRAPRRAGPCVTAAFAAVLAALAAAAATGAATADAPPLELFLAASSRDAAAQLVDSVVKSAPGFDAAYRALQRGRRYGAAQTGVVRLRNKTSDGVEHHYVLNVPETYDAARRYQVRFQLHGGVGGRPSNAPVGTGTIGALAGAEQIYVIPYAWNDAPWWSDDQVLNLVEILDATKRTYNVDENRVVVSGVSDGGTGAYWVAMRETTPFASFLPLNGYWMVLASGDIDD